MLTTFLFTMQKRVPQTLSTNHACYRAVFGINIFVVFGKKCKNFEFTLLQVFCFVKVKRNVVHSFLLKKKCGALILVSKEMWCTLASDFFCKKGFILGGSQFGQKLYTKNWKRTYILKYVRKNCHQQSYGFQNLMSSWGCGSKF